MDTDSETTKEPKSETVELGIGIWDLVEPGGGEWKALAPDKCQREVVGVGQVKKGSR